MSSPSMSGRCRLLVSGGRGPSHWMGGRSRSCINSRSASSVNWLQSYTNWHPIIGGMILEKKSSIMENELWQKENLRFPWSFGPLVLSSLGPLGPWVPGSSWSPGHLPSPSSISPKATLNRPQTNLKKKLNQPSYINIPKNELKEAAKKRPNNSN